MKRNVLAVIIFALLPSLWAHPGSLFAADELAPLLKQGDPVKWWFVFKFNTLSFPGCPANNQDQRQCPFGGDVQHTKNYEKKFSQQFVYASSEHPSLQQGDTCVGASSTDPLGATFGEIYRNSNFYVVWNDQFKNDPKLKGCGESCSAPWAHSKGMVAWNGTGEGVVIQVTTPSWPASGSEDHPRPSGNTLGCINNGNNVMVSQHFFALKLTKDDLTEVLKALQNAQVATDPKNLQIVKNGGPADVQTLVDGLGKPSKSKTVTKSKLSSGVVLISKPPALKVPPWQMVSAVLDKTPLRVATWWQQHRIYSTSATTDIKCWDQKQLGKPAAVEIATTGHWGAVKFGLEGGPFLKGNHAKFGVSTAGDRPYSIFGDMNQEGGLRDECDASQNPRGGLFYVVEDEGLHASVTELLKGDKAPRNPPPGQ